MKKSFFKALFSILISLTLIGFISSTMAWFVETTVIGSDKAPIKGKTEGAYFAYGDGSEEHPFGINSPRHLYNLAWLQYLGYFNNNLLGPTSGPVYFELDPEMETALDMAGLTLPPVGTNQFPFIGYFNGNGKTIENLDVDNVVGTNHITKKPYAVNDDALAANNVLKESTGGSTFSSSNTVSIMGMFGKTATLGANDTTTHIHDLKLDSTTITSSSTNLVVGVVAGYLDSKVSNISVSDPSINVTNSPSTYGNLDNISEYTLVGYATQNYIKQGNKKVITAEKPLVDHTTTSGSGTEFGASIPMKDIYNHLLTKHNASEPFVYNEIWDGEVNGDPSTLTKEPIYSYLGNGTNNPYAYYGIKENDRNGDEIASYTFARRPGVDAFMYLYGQESGVYNKQIDGVVSVASLNAGSEFCIGDGNGNWIGCTSLEPLNNANYNNSIADNSTGYAIKTTTDLDEAIRWVYDNGRIRTSKSTRSSNDWTSTILHYGFLALDENNTLVARTGRPDTVGYAWTKQEYYDTTTVLVDVGDGTQQEVEQINTYRIFITTSQNGVLMPNGLPYTAYLVCENGNWTVSLHDTAAHYFMQGNKYLSVNVPNNAISLVDSQENATKWYTGTDGGWMVEYNNAFYTLGVTTKVAGRHWLSRREYYAVDSNLKFSNNPSNELAATYNKADTSDGRFRLRANISDLITNIGTLGGDTKTNYYFYLRVNGNNITAVTQSNTEDPSVGAEFIDVNNLDERQFNLQFKVTSDLVSTTWESFPTYFPLSYASPQQIENDPTLTPNDVSPKNTGYIVSGNNYVHDNNNFPGDIRISDYVNNSQNNRLSASLGSGSTYNNLTIVTHEKGANGGYVAIKDGYNSGHTTVPTGLSGVTSTFKTPTELNLVRYDDSRLEIHNQFTSDFSHIHGLHFMNAQISTNNITTIPHAHILGQTYENYPMPEDCIDFNLNKNGFITFYEGTYFSGNNTFFSLHDITRNADHSISSIKEITKIYDNVGVNRANKRYLYDYSSGNNLGEGDTKGDLIFDMSWVTNPTIVNNAVYYFEIPVNKGEYALGSVSGKTGAYLMYLDIGSARKNEDITSIYETIVTQNYQSTYVNGIDFASTNSTSSVSGGETSNVRLSSTSSGTYSFSYENNTLTYTGSNAASATHIAEGVSVSSNITDGMTTGDRIQIDKTTSVNYNDFDETITTTVTETTTTNNGTPVIGTPVVSTQFNVLTYDNTIEVQNETGTIIRFRYWSTITFTTQVDFRNHTYTFIFDTDQPLDIFIEQLTPGNSGYTVIFKGSGQNNPGITVVGNEYVHLNNS